MSFFERLVGSRLVRVGRSVDILLFEFDKESPAGVERFKLHAQCPARVRRDSTLLVGSYDTHWPADENADWDTAFDTFTTVYDERAREVEAYLDKHDCRVISARLLALGMVVVELDDRSTIEVMPASSTDTEAWRIISPEGEHQVYPEDFVG
jgi:hypothetical protein